MAVRKVKGTTIGLDKSMEVIRNAVKNCDHFVCGDIFRLPFSDKSVDVVFNQGVMEHFDDKEILIIFREFERVCKRKVVLCVPASTSLFKHIWNPFNSLDGRFMTGKELISLMSIEFDNVGARYLAGSCYLSIVAWGEVKA